MINRGDTLQETWAILHSGHHDAATNMAIDEMLLTWHSKGIIPPTIRFYGWSKPSLSVGHFQNVKDTIDLLGVKKHQCDLVRRLTGGSAVLHDDELTYSIIVDESHPNIPQSVDQAYYILSQGLLEGYRLLGIDARFAELEKSRGKKRSAVCFEQAAIYEMLASGKKISGNAQTRKDGVLLQHGSIPMSMDTTMLFDLFSFPSERVRERQRSNFSYKATSINEVTGKSHTYDMLESVFLRGFEKSLHITTKRLELTSEQLEYVDYLVKTKYGRDTWNISKKRGEQINV